MSGVSRVRLNSVNSQNSVDTIDAVFGTFPIMVAITCAVVLVVMGVAFRSVLIPLRSVITISLSLMFTFGFANLTYVGEAQAMVIIFLHAAGDCVCRYEHDALGWLHIAGLANSSTIVWMSPLCTFVIICGIGLDYDVFLTVSIVEERDKGHHTRESVTRGLYRTGYIITAAGIIMAIAFFGLVLACTSLGMRGGSAVRVACLTAVLTRHVGAAITTLNQFGFYLVFAVLFDTFVVRSLLVPAMMGLLQDANWWPGFTQGWLSCKLRSLRS